MYCKKCGKQIPDDSVFCQFCGTDNSMDNATEAIDKTPRTATPLPDEHFTNNSNAVKHKNKTGLVILLVSLFVAVGVLAYFGCQTSSKVYVYRGVGWRSQLVDESLRNTIEEDYKNYKYLIIEDTGYVLYNSDYKYGRRHESFSKLGEITTELYQGDDYSFPVIYFGLDREGKPLMDIMVDDSIQKENSPYYFLVVRYDEEISNFEAIRILLEYKNAKIF